jgi:hypothetical protein
MAVKLQKDVTPERNKMLDGWQFFFGKKFLSQKS